MARDFASGLRSRRARVLQNIYMGKRGGAQGRSRTADTGIFSPLLYQLSYLGILAGGAFRPLRRGVGGLIGKIFGSV